MLFGAKTIEEALGVRVLVDQELERQRELWRSMLNGTAPWNNDKVPSLRIAKGIAKEAARYTVFELKSEVGGARGEYLNPQWQKIIDNALEDVKELAGNGSIIFKPYVRGKRILVTTVANNCYYPLQYNELDELISVVFADTIQKQVNGEIIDYTLLEKHEWIENTLEYIITYRAYKNKSNVNRNMPQGLGIGKEILLSQVSEWAHLQPENRFINIEQPLFVEVNLSEMKSIFADAKDIVKETDKQYGYTVWEYYTAKRKIHASIDVFKRDEVGDLILPDKDIYVIMDKPEGGLLFDHYSPDIRHQAFFEGLNEYKRQIEFIIGFAYGVISDPQQQDKTATEVRAGKQRFLITIQTIQKTLEEAYNKLIKSMDILATIYSLFPQGDYDISFTWGDSIMEDPDVEYQRRKEMVALGYLKPEHLIAWYFGLDYDPDNPEKNKQLRDLMPNMAEMVE